MNRIAVIGIGPVTPVAMGGDAFGDAIRKGTSAAPDFRVPPFELGRFFAEVRAFRRVADSTRLLLAAAGMALEDAGIDWKGWDADRAGLVVGVTHGVLSLSTRFHAGLVQEGPQGASPLYFSESVLNAPAGNAAIAFGIKGPVHTISGEETVGVQAVDLASRMLRSGSVDLCVVAGVEERSELVEGAYALFDRAAFLRRKPEAPPPFQAEGAAAIVLEREEGASRNGRVARAVLSGWSFVRDPSISHEESAFRAILAAHRFANISPQEIEHVLPPTDRNRSAVARAVASLFGKTDSVRVVDLQKFIGNPTSAAVLLQISASAALLPGERAGSHGLVLSCGVEGTAAAVLVSSPDGMSR